MKRFINSHKKALAAVAAVAIVISGGMGAYAYWAGGVSTTASNGTVTADGSTSNITVSAGTVSGLRPDGVSVNVPVTLTNLNAYSVATAAGHISGSFGSATPSSCTAALANLTITSTSLPAHTFDKAGTAGASEIINVPVSMADSGTSTDQTPCQGAVLTLSFAAGA